MVASCTWTWIRFPEWLPYVFAAFALETVWALWMAGRKEFAGVISPDGLFTIRGKKVLRQVPWQGIGGVKLSQWSWLVQVLAPGQNGCGVTLDLGTPTLAREFVRIAEEVRKTRVKV
jgi:hypothetical protein